MYIFGSMAFAECNFSSNKTSISRFLTLEYGLILDSHSLPTKSRKILYSSFLCTSGFKTVTSLYQSPKASGKGGNGCCLNIRSARIIINPNAFPSLGKWIQESLSTKHIFKQKTVIRLSSTATGNHMQLCTTHLPSSNSLQSEPKLYSIPTPSTCPTLTHFFLYKIPLLCCCSFSVSSLF